MPILLVPGDYHSDKAMRKREVRETTVGALLPDSFGPEQLKMPRIEPPE
jgi:hypothetical protein